MDVHSWGREPLPAPPVLLVDPDPAHRHDVAAVLAEGRLTNPLLPLGSLADLRDHLAEGGTAAAAICSAGLPDGDCVDVIAALATRRSTRRTPVVVTASSTRELIDSDAAYAAGAAAYLLWPVAATGLVDVLRRLDLPWQLAVTA